MMQVIESPTVIAAAGEPPKQIEEYVGVSVTGTNTLSIARMVSPPGWSEEGQTPEFDEYTVVLSGALHVESREEVAIIRAGQAVITPAHSWVRYSTPDGAEYIAVCHPAFTRERVPRDVPGGETPASPDYHDSIMYETGGSDLLDRVATLWLLQRDHHAATSRFFSDQIRNRTFDDRRSDILSQNRNRSLLVILARKKETGEMAGFCISSGARGEPGEIESIFVHPQMRGWGIGSELMRRSRTWMEHCGCDGCRVMVGDGNEDVLPFYQKFGFFPRYHHLLFRPERS